MRMEQIKHITIANKYKSISRASESLYITQPTLSRSITAFEKEIGAKLFLRNAQGISLSPIGEVLMPHFENIIEEFNYIQTLLTNDDTISKNVKINIVAGNMILSNIIPEIMPEFKEINPFVEISFSVKYHNEAIDEIISRHAKIAFISVTPNLTDDTLKYAKDNNLHCEFLLETPLRAIIPVDSSLNKFNSLRLEMLESLTLYLNNGLNVKTEVTSAPIYCQDVCKMIYKNGGYAIQSELEIYNEPYIKQGLLSALPLENVQPISIYLVYRNSSTLSKYEKDIIHLIKEKITAIASTPSSK